MERGSRTQYDAPASYLTGDLDEIRIWNVARSQADIQAARFRALTNTELTSTNLVAYYNSDSWSSDDPFMLKDLSHNAWEITLATSQSQAVPVTRLMPKILPSDTPYYGSKSHVLQVTRATAQWNGTYDYSLLPGQTPADAQLLMIQVTALPLCAAPNLVLTRKDTGNTLTATDSFSGGVPISISAGAALSSTPREDRCFLRYNILQGATTIGTDYKLEFIVQVNRPPVVGDAGGALYCDGGNSFAYDKDFTFGVPNTELQYSFEWWAYNWEPLADGTIYAVGVSEVNDDGGDWCYAKSNNNETRWSPADFCQGRLLTHGPNAAGQIQAYHAWKQFGDGSPLAEAASYQQTWYHVAVTADAQDISVFINGEFKKSAHYFHGFLDEFRIFNYSRSSAMIRETMHNKLRGNEVGLLAYYNFDDFRDSDAFAQSYANSDPIKDGTNSGRQLIPGGCTPNKQPWCPLGDGLCNALESPRHPCFDADGTTQVFGAQPVLYPSGAPVGGYGFPVVFNGTAQNSEIALPARGSDADALLLEVVSVPDASRVILTAKGSAVIVGTRLKASDKVNVTIVDPMFGGRPSTSFSYKAYDSVEWSLSVQKVDIHIQCPPDTHLDDANRRCVSCPTGTYNEEHSFTTTCSEYSNVLWASAIGGVITFVNSLAVLVTLVMAGVIVFFRKAKPMIASSPTFCLLIVIGALLGLADVYTYVGMPSTLSCALQPALVSLGFTLALGNLVLKTFRIHFIFNYARKARDVPWALKSSFLGMKMMFAIVIDLFILVAWFAADIPRPTVLLDTNGAKYVGCQSVTPLSGTLAGSLLIVYNAIWLLTGIYLTVRIRNVKSDYNESQHIIPCIYILLLVSLILVPINYTSDILPFRVRTIFVCFLQIIASTFLVCQMFIPKVIACLAWRRSGGGSAVATDASNTISQAIADFESGNPARSQDKGGGASGGVKTYLEIPMIEVSSGGLLLKYTAHTGFILKESNQLVLKKFRQQPAMFYSFNSQSFTRLNTNEIAFKGEDESLKIRFETEKSRDGFLAAILARGTMPNVKQTAARSINEAV
ncbi:hypothetical protein HDU89_005454 [Geranomyces variabilis]|nr:hypothetical protein HDU89_005454 [Geranomyces variabilis]